MNSVCKAGNFRMQRLLSALLLALGASGAFAFDCSGLPEWDSAAAYTGGAQVKYNNYAYKANWWSQGANPESHSGQ